MDGGLGGAPGSESNPVTWPASLNDIWTDIAALFAVENILEAATELPRDAFLKYARAAPAPHLTAASAAHASGGGRGAGKNERSRGGRGQTRKRGDQKPTSTGSHDHMHSVTLPATILAAPPDALKRLTDVACMCVADVMMASIGSLTCSYLSVFIASFTQAPGNTGGTTEAAAGVPSAGLHGPANNTVSYTHLTLPTTPYV